MTEKDSKYLTLQMREFLESWEKNRGYSQTPAGKKDLEEALERSRELSEEFRLNYRLSPEQWNTRFSD